MQMMDQEQRRNQLVREHFDSRNVAGCPLCGERVDLRGGPVVVLPHADQLDRRDGTIGQGSRVISVMCGECGNVMFIAELLVPGYE